LLKIAETNRIFTRVAQCNFIGKARKWFKKTAASPCSPPESQIGSCFPLDQGCCPLPDWLLITDSMMP
jgi:hypothetical protein